MTAKTKLALSIITALLLTTTLSAQQNASIFVEVKGDVKVADMVQKHIEFNERVQTIPGYRIQIASLSGANSKDRAFELRDRFVAEHSELQAYIIFDEPNFKVKVGDFRTRLEAYRFLQSIKETYGGYIIKDNIYPAPLDFNDLVPESEDDF
ncbi:MAG: SPOR domain-containing protein [Bacteroidales bacterium]|nr:SPOR domain-containing protein [Bacteroidales bacterium]